MTRPPSKERPLVGKPRGTPAPADDVHPLVLAVLQAVGRATATRRHPHYVSVSALELPPDLERNGAAILLAVMSGYLTAGGDPPHSVAITWKGRTLLKARGLD